VNRRDFLLTCGCVLARPALSEPAGRVEWARRLFSQSPAPAAAPADRWVQFRGSPSLTGVSATTIAPAPKLAWAWEGGEAFDSSAAIADGVVYVGTATGELIAVGLADGKLRWRYKAGEAIGESSKCHSRPDSVMSPRLVPSMA